MGILFDEQGRSGAGLVDAPFRPGQSAEAAMAEAAMAESSWASEFRRRLGFDVPPYRLQFETMDLSARVGLIGLHWVMLTMHLPAYRAARFSITASCEIVPDRIAEARAASFPIGRAIDRYEELIAAPDVDVIDCCFGHRPSQMEHRRRVVELCTSSKKDVMIHKPPARRLGDAIELQDIAVRGGIRLACNQNCRYNPANYTVKQLLVPSRLGRPMTIELQCYWRGSVPSWASTDPATIGHTIHHADLIRWWVDSPCVSVTARARGRSSMTIYEFESGTLAYHMENHSGVRNHQVTTNIMAEQGVIRHGHNWNWHLPSSAAYDFVHIWRNTREEPVVMRLPEHVYEPSWSQHNPWIPSRGPYYDLGAPVAGMMGSLGSLIHANRSNALPDNSYAASIESLRMCLAAQVSARTGRSIDPSTLDPQTQAIL